MATTTTTMTSAISKEDHNFSCYNPFTLWREGPTKLWLDMLGIPDDADTYDQFGSVWKNPDDSTNNNEIIEEYLDDLNLNEEAEEDEEIPSENGYQKNRCDTNNNNTNNDYNDGAFHLVSQEDWESRIIWNVNQEQESAATDDDDEKKTRSKNENASKYWDYILEKTDNKPIKFRNVKSQPNDDKRKIFGGGDNDAASWQSIFSNESEGLNTQYRWEDDIIWDIENLPLTTNEPKLPTFDLNDKNIIFCLPDDVDPDGSTSAPSRKSKIPNPHAKQSKALLGRTGVIKLLEDDKTPTSSSKDPFNISNDEYYDSKYTQGTAHKLGGGNLLRHSIPTVHLSAPFITTYLGTARLRSFHRPSLKKYFNGALSTVGPHPVLALTKHISKKHRQREAERLASGGGFVFQMRTPEDLSGKDGTLVLVEYCERHPPLLSEVGMCSTIKNYFKRFAEKNAAPPVLPLGETILTHSSPFLGILSPGQVLQAIENNMYRSPIYPHSKLDSDFILIRTRNSWYVREYDYIFTAGQECPLIQVPPPGSKIANNFVRDFLQVFIYRLFWKSRELPRKIRLDDIRLAFPLYSEATIRKRLKHCADYRAAAIEGSCWYLKPDFRLPNEEELQAIITPEQYCAFASHLASQQRLKDAGYCESFLFSLGEAGGDEKDDNNEDNNNNNEVSKKVDDEVKCATWNTTRAFLQAKAGKCFLDLVGPADPTGVGEGFSYIRTPIHPQVSKKQEPKPPPKLIKGTDADLRKLSLSSARNVLRRFLVPEAEIKKLTRWEAIDVVRTLSTEKARQGDNGIVKFSRTSRFSFAERQERYKEECQRIFELQNRLLSTDDPLTSDEEAGDDDSDEDEGLVEDELAELEEMGKDIEKILANKATSEQVLYEKEEEERKLLQKLIMENDDKNISDKNLEKGTNPDRCRILKIHRTFHTDDGREFTRTEIIRQPSIIDIYVRIRSTKDEGFIRNFTFLNNPLAREAFKNKKRRLVDMVRRAKKRNKETQNKKAKQILKDTVCNSKKMREAVVKEKRERENQMRCGACNQFGHMRTNKICRYYKDPKSSSLVPPIYVAMTEEQTQDLEHQLNDLDEKEGEELLRLDGIKFHVSGKFFKQVDDISRRSLLKPPKNDGNTKKKKRGADSDDYDYLAKPEQTIKRSRIDPHVMVSNIFESILNEMRADPDSFHFKVPVKKAPHYYEIIKSPMDLQTMRDKIRNNLYDCSSEFLNDAKLLVTNSATYNGEKSLITQYAQKIYDIAERKVADNSEKLSLYEKMINPLLDDNLKTKLNYLLSKFLQNAKMMPEAAIFLRPVNRKVEGYYDVIEHPMDLDTIDRKIQDCVYNSRYDFLHDLDLIQLNAIKFNGVQHAVAEQATYMVELVKKSLVPFDSTLTGIEIGISKAGLDKIEEVDGGDSSTSSSNKNYLFPKIIF